MAKSVKAPDFDSGTVGSSPAIPARPDPLAQSVEHLPFKQGVRGSIPRRVTKVKIKSPETAMVSGCFAVMCICPCIEKHEA